jgi:hypothetical protein
MNEILRNGALVVLLGIAAPAAGQIYGYTDERGVLVLSNIPSDGRMTLIADTGFDSESRPFRYNGEYDDIILAAAQRAGVDSALLMALIAVESGFNRFAVSRKGAMGLMQLMPGTARELGVTNPYDPAQNINAGTRYLSDLLGEFGNLQLALAAYNAGPEVVRRLRRVPSYPETVGHVRKVMSLYGNASRISIAKGGKIFTVGPNGQPRVSSQSSIEQGIRKLRSLPPRGATTAAAPPGNPRAVAGLELPAAPPAPEKATYYRYRDPSGVIYITPDKPASGEFEVLP